MKLYEYSGWCGVETFSGNYRLICIEVNATYCRHFSAGKSVNFATPF
jgi:hypothetical protein